MRVLVTGGAGYIGSVVCEELARRGHEVVAYDNLRNGHRAAVIDEARFVHGDIIDRNLIEKSLIEHGIEAVVHMAADALVGESVSHPANYYRNNVTAGLVLLDAMRATGVKRLVFSSTAAVYGEPASQPIRESDPTSPTNPYGESKLAFERAIKWYAGAYDLKYTTLRYFNAAGATERCGEVHDPETHLIPIALQVASREREHLDIYGADYSTRDGTCIRDYIHVADLALAHALALESEEGSGVFNLGCGRDGYTVLEVVKAVEEVTGVRIPTRIAPRRAGDPAVLIAGSELIRERLGWNPERQNLATIVESAWKWLQLHPHGYPRE